jgi:Pyruvate/2-oxoacid:ferredoxin oxidoreductase delta subunit
MRTFACILPACLLGHLAPGRRIFGEYSPVRLLLMKVFARYIEVPLLHLVYLMCIGRLKLLERLFLTRWLIVYPVGFAVGHWGDTGRPIPVGELVQLIEGLEGRIAVGPCRCRIGHRACDHPMETDIVIRSGTDVWLEAFPDEYRVIEKAEAIEIIRECAALGMFHMVFRHCPIGAAVNEYVVCNCCTDGCSPYLANRYLGQRVYSLVRGEWKAEVDAELCEGCGRCVVVCPFAARVLVGGTSRVMDCYGCGLCAIECSTAACHMAGPASGV